MRKDFFERILARFQARRFGAQMIEQFWRASAGLGLANAQFFFHARACGRLWIPAPSGRADIWRDKSAFTDRSRSRSARGGLFFALATRRIAIDGGQIFGDLRELILERGRFAQQPQDGF